MNTAVQHLNLMVDIETVSTENNAGILSIGAVPFMWDEQLPEFYEKCSLASLEEKKYHVSRSTLNWWDKQDPLVRAEAFSGTQPIDSLLVGFSDYISSLPAPVLLWGNGADFDNVILHNAFDTEGLELPWNFRNNRCFRTLKNLFPGLTFPVLIGKAHNALADASYQASCATIIFNHIEKLQIDALSAVR